MEGLKIMLVEDDLVLAQDLAEQLEEQGYKVVAKAGNTQSALLAFKRHRPDLAIIDIRLDNNQLEGILIATQFNHLRPIPIIYLTGIGEAPIRQLARATRPANYLIKPHNEYQLTAAIELAIDNFHQGIEAAYQKTDLSTKEMTQDFFLMEDCFFAKKNHRYVKINIDEILWVEAANILIDIHTRSQRLVFSTSLKSFCEQIQHPQLIRVHRSYVVNIHQVEAFAEGQLYFSGASGAKRIPIGPMYRDNFFRHVTRLQTK